MRVSKFGEGFHYFVYTMRKVSLHRCHLWHPLTRSEQGDKDTVSKKEPPVDFSSGEHAAIDKKMTHDFMDSEEWLARLGEGHSDVDDFAD